MIGAQHGRELQADLFLLGWREDGDNAVDAFDRIQRVQRGKNHVAGFGRVQSGADGFEVAHFADQDDVRILTQAGAQRGGKRWGIDFHFALVDVTLFVAVQKFDWVFDGDDVLGASGIDAVHHGSEGRGLTGARNARYQDKAARHIANLLDHLGQKELVERANLGGNHAEHKADVAALLKHVDTEASQAGDAVGHIDFRGLFEFLFLTSRHHAESHIQHVFGGTRGWSVRGNRSPSMRRCG
jgi:hypothetical protein